MNWLLFFVPLALLLQIFQRPALTPYIFLAAALAVIPLAGMIGDTTEILAERVGATLGGLLNATFGNATELIIALFALHAGLFDVVKASISGSIISNILLVLGASMFAGGLRHETQRFNRTHAGASAAMLFLAVAALVMPAVFTLVKYGNLNVTTNRAPLPLLSLLVAIVLLLIYAANLIFSLKTHRMILAPAPEVSVVTGGTLSARHAGLLLLLATLFTAGMSELLVRTISGATHALHMTNFFVGIVVVAIIGNAAEHFSAIALARKNKMDAAVTIATASSTQVALFVAPVLVFVSFLLGRPMSLVFNPFEITGIVLAVTILSVVSLDGESNWFEGLQLLAVYAVLAIVFFFV